MTNERSTRGPKPAERSAGNVLLCMAAGGGASLAHVRRRGGGTCARQAFVTSRGEAARMIATAGRHCRLIAVLPKRHYLLKTLSLPRAAGDQTETMLALEVEADLPSEFGSAEISFCKLPGGSEGRDSYEVYIARHDDLVAYIEQLADLGLRPEAILPSAAAWRQRLGADRAPADLLAAFSDHTGELEVASLAEDGAMSVRTFTLNGAAEGAALERALVESVRVLAPSSRASGEPVEIGWLGRMPEDLSLDGQARIASVDEQLLPLEGRDAEPVAMEPLLRVAAAAVLGAAEPQALRDANRVLREALLGQLRRKVYRAALCGAGLATLAVLLAMGALALAIGRLQSITAAQQQAIGRIKIRGEAAGRRISQLQAVRQRQRTRRDFYSVISGLYGATPQGITYSQIDMNSDGKLTLRGQATSVSLPFLLPELLERQPMFKNVVLQSAGQKKRGAGSVTEFRLDCELRRSRRR